MAYRSVRLRTASRLPERRRYDRARAAKFGSGIVMLGRAGNDDPYHVRSPQELGGAATGGVYVVLERDEEVDAHCARARAAGAEIIAEPEDADYGGRGYGARDLEGYYWSFGTYRPLAP